MARGRILIVHNSKAVRSILRRRTLAEAPDFVVDEAQSPEAAINQLEDGTFDLVICDEVLAGLPDSDWLSKWKHRNASVEHGYIFLVSEATTIERQGKLAQFGLHAFLDAQCTAGDIAKAIAAVYDPRHRRQHRRVSIPGAQARVGLAGATVSADIVNMSVAGMLCESHCPLQFGDIVLPAEVAISLPSYLDTSPIDCIHARVLRIQVVSRNDDNRPDRIRTAWEFFHVPDDTYRRLDAVMSIADEEAPPESRAL